MIKWLFNFNRDVNDPTTIAWFYVWFCIISILGFLATMSLIFIMEIK